jgi:hypothetical protein
VRQTTSSSHDFQPTILGKRGAFPQRHLPAPLPKNREESEQMYDISAKKLMRQGYHIGSKYTEAALTDVIETQNVDKGIPKRILNYKEVILGPADIKDIGGLNFNSSPGLPFSQTDFAKEARALGITGKHPWFPRDANGDIDFEDKYTLAVQAQVNRIIRAAKEGKRIESLAVYKGSLKSELRTLDKVRNKQVRLFAVGPMALMIATKMYYGAWVAHTMATRPHGEIAVGTNAYSEWEKLEEWLESNGSAWLALDFKNYDGSALRAILSMIHRCASAWYDDGPEAALIRSILNEYHTSSIWELDGYIVQMDKSLPSGMYLTAIGNSFQGMMLWRIAYMIAKEEAGLVAECSTFKDFCAFINYGDDMMGTINPKGADGRICTWFNGTIIAEILGRYGYVITDINKNLEVPPFIAKDEVSFLKRTFRRHEGLVVAPLDKETIERIPLWWHESSPLTSDEDLKTRIRGCQIEAWAHGHDYWNYFTDTIRRHLVASNKPLHFLFDERTCHEFWYEQRHNPTKVKTEGKPFGTYDIGDFVFE